MHVGLSSVIKLNRTAAICAPSRRSATSSASRSFAAAGVRTAADLKGGAVGVSAFGSESDSTVTLALARLGLRREDVVLKEYGGGMRRLEALKSGEIKGTRHQRAGGEPRPRGGPQPRWSIWWPRRFHGCSAASW